MDKIEIIYNNEIYWIDTYLWFINTHVTLYRHDDPYFYIGSCSKSEVILLAEYREQQIKSILE